MHSQFYFKVQEGLCKCNMVHISCVEYMLSSLSPYSESSSSQPIGEQMLSFYCVCLTIAKWIYKCVINIVKFVLLTESIQSRLYYIRAMHILSYWFLCKCFITSFISTLDKWLELSWEQWSVCQGYPDCQKSYLSIKDVGKNGINILWHSKFHLTSCI